VDAFFTAMLWPLALCLVLAALCTYLGLQLLARKAVFADLALAQVAALGSVWGVLLGWSVDEDPWSLRGFAFAFAIVGAAILAGARSKDLPREAIAGALYATAAGGTLLVGTSLHHGIEEVRDLLAGTTLFVTPGTVAALAALFTAIGAFLHASRARWTAAPRASVSALWDFTFYAALGLAVSLAAPLVGVLLVFAYLLLPAAAGTLLTRGPAGRLRAAWGCAAVATALGFVLSYGANLPLEATLVVCLGATLGAAATLRYLKGTGDRLGASIGVLGGTTVVVLMLALSFEMRPTEEAIDLTAADAPSGARLALVDRLASEPDLWERERATLEALLTQGDPEVRSRLLELIADREDLSWLERVHGLLLDPDDFVRESALFCVRDLGRAESADALATAAEAEQDEFLHVELADALLQLGDGRGAVHLLDLMEGGRGEGARREAARRLGAREPIELDYDPAAGEEQRATAVAALRRRLGQ
jgi:zinc/manganese transport system permease protein